MNNPRVLGLLPARAGSKGLPGKNLLKILDKTLVEWAGSALMESKLIDKRVCSTDSPAIRDVAIQAGLEVPFLRPAEISGDYAPVLESVLHAINYLEEREGLAFDYVAIVQATCPTVLSNDIDRAINHAIRKGLDSVVSANKVELGTHPATMFCQDPDENVIWALGPKNAELRRQDWPAVYVRVGLTYVFRVNHLKLNQGFYSGKTGFIEVEVERSLGIDTQADFDKVKKLMEELRFS
jgi:CMP-N-acetylneuraminic acid synthetase